jgi:hypothetical protein
MNFTIWILNRIKNTLLNVLQLGQGQWGWVREYRNLILKQKVVSFLVTIFGGLLWFMISFVASIAMIDSKENIFFALRAAILAVPAFYVYHWLAALHEIYRAEVMKTWDALNQDHQRNL